MRGVDLQLHARDQPRRLLDRLRRTHEGSEVALHDKRILAIGVIAGTRAHGHEAKRLVERLRALVARADLERDRLRTEIARICRNVREQLAGDAAAAPRWIRSHFQDLHIAVDHPAAGIPHKHADLTRLAFARVRRPPGAIAPRDLVGHKRFAPRIASHDARLERRDASRMGKVERLVRYPLLIGRSHENRLLVKRGVVCRRGLLVSGRLPRERMDERRMGHRFGILDARAKVCIGNAQRRRALATRASVSRSRRPFASRTSCTGTLVFLRVGQARVHGKRKRRVMSHCIERVAFPAVPRSLKREEKPRARRRPRALGKHLPA